MRKLYNKMEMMKNKCRVKKKKRKVDKIVIIIHVVSRFEPMHIMSGLVLLEIICCIGSGS